MERSLPEVDQDIMGPDHECQDTPRASELVLGVTTTVVGVSLLIACHY